MAEEHPLEHEESQDGNGREPADYETELAHYLQERIKPGLSSSAIPLVARSIAKEIASHEPSEELSSNDGGQSANGAVPDFEADMHELQEELGDDWILRFSVHGEDGWLTAETQDSRQRVEAETADQLLRIVEAIEPERENGATEGD